MAKASRAPAFGRVVLKLSGEAFQGGPGGGVDPAAVLAVAREIMSVRELGVQTAVITGGGNIIRGRTLSSGRPSIARPTADSMGMLGTIINGLALVDILEQSGASARAQSATEMPRVAETYTRSRALSHLEKGRVVVLVGGTGNPFFTTDTTAGLRAFELGADVVLKATKVDGVYSRDPVKHPGARRFRSLTYSQLLDKKLRVMDLTAVTLCRDCGIPVIVYDFFVKGNSRRVVLGEEVGTRVS